MAKQEWVTRRKETKYYVNILQKTRLSALLSATLSRDRNSNSEGFYFVRSVYFDSANHMDLMEKEMGVKHRRKIRLRYYSHDPSLIKFETKEKDNKSTIKRSITIDKREAKQLINKDYSQLIDKESAQIDVQLKLYEHLKTHHYEPVRIVDYEREAYIHLAYNIRINFDMNIRGTNFVENLFEEKPSMIPLIDPGICIMEIKHDGHLPDFIQQIISGVDLSQVSFSKYYFSMLT